MNIQTRPTKRKDIAQQELRRFVFDFDPRADSVPKCVERSQVAQFVQGELHKPGLGAAQARQLADLADFYDLRQLAPEFLDELLQPATTEERFGVATASCEAVGVLGSGAVWARGRDRYNELFASPYAASRMQELLACFNAYTPPEDQRATLQRLDDLVRKLRPQADADPAAGVAMRNLEDMKNNTLPRIVQAAAIRRDILALPDAAARLDRSVGIYLKLSMNYQEWLNRWAVRVILREYYERGPVQPLQAFRRALDTVRASSQPEEEKRVRRAVAFHAIDFLGGALSDAELAEARALAPNLAGLLSLDRTCPR
jgi:hypothetical protein